MPAEVVRQLGMPTGSPFAFPPDWEADRQEAIRVLQALPQAMPDAEQALRG